MWKNHSITQYLGQISATSRTLYNPRRYHLSLSTPFIGSCSITLSTVPHRSLWTTYQELEQFLSMFRQLFIEQVMLGSHIHFLRRQDACPLKKNTSSFSLSIDAQHPFASLPRDRHRHSY